MARVHCVRPVHVPRIEVSLGVRKASLSHSVVLARDQRVVVVVVVVEERRERGLVLLPPQMFGRFRAHAGSAAGDQRRRPHFSTGRLHRSFASLGLNCFKELHSHLNQVSRGARAARTVRGATTVAVFKINPKGEMCKPTSNRGNFFKSPRVLRVHFAFCWSSREEFDSVNFVLSALRGHAGRGQKRIHVRSGGGGVDVRGATLSVRFDLRVLPSFLPSVSARARFSEALVSPLRRRETLCAGRSGRTGRFPHGTAQTSAVKLTRGTRRAMQS